ncbi:MULTISPECIES: ESX secretion-associated protein EspG [unclassified Nocardia]|uniref:ESX secretion-associated protein EspG n=2 Tax=Nocardia TaxID=1817 RepID=UPI00278C4593|nr:MULTISPECIES: ESX secretion-associated protein EspG [unclassified Nocardia]
METESALRTWTLTDLELLVLWEDLGAEFLPWPLVFASRTEWWSEHLENLARTRDTLRDRDRAVDEVLRAVHAPDLRIAVFGQNGCDPHDPHGSIRILGARCGDLAYLVTQLPGETVRHSSGFTIAEFYANELAERVVAALPDVGAGRGREIVLAGRDDSAEVDYGFGLSPAHETMDGSVVDRAADFMAAPASSVGTIDVVQGRSRFGPRGLARYRLEWRDLTDDGRYVIIDEYPRVAVAADRGRLTATLHNRMAEVMLVLEDEHV